MSDETEGQTGGKAMWKAGGKGTWMTRLIMFHD